MRVLVCGGRDYNDYETVARELQRFGDISLIIQGGARGADNCGARYAEANGIDVKEFRADWERYGKRAGPIRNQQMLDEGAPDLIVAFPGGSGTADMVLRAKKACIRTIIMEK